jgi:hypothetical protein
VPRVNVERVVSAGRYAAIMARPKMDQDATGKLRPGDKTQVTPKGTKLGHLSRETIFADFKKIIRKPAK